MAKYFYTDGKEKFGPFSIDELAQKDLSRETKVWTYGMEQWMELSQVSALNRIMETLPPPLEPTLLKAKHNNPIEQEKASIKTKKRSSFLKPLLISAVSISVVVMILYSLLPEKRNMVQYNTIVQNAYDGEEDFDFYVDKFYRDLEFFGIYPKKPKKQIIRFSRLDQIDNATHYHGISYGYNDDDLIEIYINPSTWEKFNKPMRYLLMYHELSHDILNEDDLEALERHEGKLMYPAIDAYENITMDEFIESSHELFENQ